MSSISLPVKLTLSSEPSIKFVSTASSEPVTVTVVVAVSVFPFPSLIV